ALLGMGRVRPDPGALTWMGLSLAGRTVRFVNASAANDPESTAAIFEHLHLRPDYERPLIVVLNARRDRPLRTVQLVGHLGSLLRADHYLVVGELSWAMKKRLAKLARAGLPLEILGQVPPQKVQERIAALARAGSTVVGIGNIGGMGRALIELCAGMKKS
ncbi:MAG: hypothetical protein ONB17_03530, partial [candidate division KSB1 bacterium]|nr:hypothetical protein [candidate division KSB1 bacterium]